jgi:serine/threonine-protein kinase
MVLIAIVSAKPTPTTELAAGDEALWKIIAKGLEKDPDDRYQTMRELGQALARWVRDQGAETDVAGTSIAVHWLAERARRPLSDIPRAHEASPPASAATDVPTPPSNQAIPIPQPPPQQPSPPTAPVEEGSRGRITWPPRALHQQARAPSLEDLVKPVTLPPGLAGGGAGKWIVGLLVAGLAITAIVLYLQRDNADVHGLLEKIGIVDPLPGDAAPIATATEAPAPSPPPPPAATAPPPPTQPPAPTYRHPQPRPHGRNH